jgi:hypothetical protein
VANLTAVRNALAAQITALSSDSNGVPLNCVAQPLDQITPPCGLVLPARTNVAKFGICLGEGLVDDNGLPLSPAEFNLEVLVIVAHASTTERVQQQLDEWLGFESFGTTTTSVAAAIAQDPTLGNTVDFAEANNVVSYGPVDYNGTPYFGARISVVVSTQ